MGARTFPGNPYDGHTLAAQLEQTSTLLQDLDVKPTTAIVELWTWATVAWTQTSRPSS